MKFSAVLFAALASSTSAFAPARPSVSRGILSAATLEAPAAVEAPAEPASEAPAASDMGVEKDWPVDQANFVKDSERVLPGRYNDTPNSIAVPFLPRPTALDGSHAGDYGFDPLGLSEKLDFYAMQESEVRHARLAMLAAVGWPMSELLAPSWMLQNGCAPSVLNGVNPLSFLAIAGFLGAAGWFELKTSLRASQATPMGKIHEKDMSAVWKYGVPGDYNWDPLNLYSSCGDDFKGRKGLRDVELSHGRVAMLGITYFAFWEALTGHPIVENNMLFHPNALFPLLVAGYVGWTQIYEVGSLTEYPIEIKYTNEGEMKLNRLKSGIQATMSQVNSSTSASKSQLDELDDKFDIYEKLAAGPKKIEDALRSTYKYW
mmetsp:Transcript_21885/g.46848  ORF Transcript_21885/g.46848 Transcript_21885/m.46848 type:complete len:374 (+) Transcript_21885:184-1305(+)|eukprot:CAMPEP_0172526078 /NCGR_PEP_ID=MMETSP1067-20121228/1082_1 /TAXON_ID=265564 ORGANISM="Thalassiosira punctigera, Strain Tpunct2005C2" /NCGR_SAMPLE_ID=MMETSP1067 /ASSEMBLY_ACC=CAM_ASM_000444 /LENGTH=373 /DNA_ID=CAMNT_0013309515 /DNA_START=184 /DNA_END=1305 /DNA_ORIENTATION=-